MLLAGVNGKMSALVKNRRANESSRIYRFDHRLLAKRNRVQSHARVTTAGAQTERRGGAGPVRGLLGGKDPTRRFSLIL
jgi:hypothetical protein